MLFTPALNIGYCGPTAIAAVTGESKRAIYDAIHTARLDTCGAEAYQATKDGSLRRMPVFGLSHIDLLSAMDLLGWDVKADRDCKARRKAGYGPYRLRDFFDYTQMHEGSYIVATSTHYIAVSEGEACDTYTKMPIDIIKWKRGLGRHVEHWWRFEN